MKIGGKLIFSHLALALVPAVLLGVVLGVRSSMKLQELNRVADEEGVAVIVEKSESEVQKKVELTLMSNTMLKQTAIKSFLIAMFEKLDLLSVTADVEGAFDRFTEDVTASNGAVLTDSWKALAAEYDEYFTHVVEIYGWYDVFLISEAGQIIYTQARESDLGEFLGGDQLRSSNFNEAFERIQSDASMMRVIADFKPYAPSNGDQAAFVIKRMPARNGYIAFQLNTDKINQIVQQRVGLGDTGETYLVGRAADGQSYYRSDRVVKSGKIGQPKSDMIIKRAFAGESGIEIKTGSTGDEEIVSFIPLGFDGLDWVIITTMATQEALAAIADIKTLGGEVKGAIETTRADSTQSAIWWTAGMLMAVAVFGGVLAYMIAAGLARPIGRGADRLKSLAEKGDLSVVISDADKARRDEVGDLARSINVLVGFQRREVGLATALAEGDWAQDIPVRSDKDELGLALQTMVDQINETLESVREASMQVDSGATQIADASQSLSQGATESAASLEQITSSMTEIGSQTKQNAENAQQANQLAIAARGAAETGAGQMQSMTTAMADIEGSSAEITKIIKVIDDIAFQTNLLALNAAVEAARAGRYGKGFAVVAEEVRNLAARSAKAAKETAQLIESSNQKVNNGTDIAKQTSAALTEIVAGVTKAADLVGEIAAASNEQAEGVSQVSQGLGQIDSVTQQNTANAEETASAAEELSGQSKRLEGLLARFRLKHSAGMGSPSGGRLGSDPRPSANTLPPVVKAALPAAEPPPSEGAARPWGGGSKAKEVDPREIIKLDDDEFGKY